MNNLDYFKSELMVHFTLKELYELTSALATESFSERYNQRYCNADFAWALRDKVKQFIHLYKDSLL